MIEACYLDLRPRCEFELLLATFGPKTSKHQAHKAGTIERLLSNAAAEWVQPCESAAHLL